VAHQGDVFEHLIALAPVAVQRAADLRPRQAHRRRPVPERGQPLGLAEGQRPQRDAVDDAEDGGGGADAERDREDRRGGEAGLLAQHARAVAQVLEQMAGESDAARVAARFLHLFGAAGLPLGYRQEQV
jgi:hypothetical protein